MKSLKKQYRFSQLLYKISIFVWHYNGTRSDRVIVVLRQFSNFAASLRLLNDVFVSRVSQIREYRRGVKGYHALLASVK